MEITFRDAVTVMHGMAFGGLLLLTFSGAGIALYAISAGGWTRRPAKTGFLGWYFSAMAALGWLTVFAGAICLSWYRARPRRAPPIFPAIRSVC